MTEKENVVDGRTRGEFCKWSWFQDTKKSSVSLRNGSRVNDPWHVVIDSKGLNAGVCSTVTMCRLIFRTQWISYDRGSLESTGGEHAAYLMLRPPGVWMRGGQEGYVLKSKQEADDPSPVRFGNDNNSNV